ncbi:sulfurtransferase TusA family protein [Antarcticimicrobium luteum]|uniref:Sulfurtransferase TusA family protein n=1 Tax=Antarcticimicrobium luteum TaxID=2547397 RepID=A0A4R5VDG8_9RHOB|nr:sulfurtransferase TusA family protein [Antarcticimicrobium luteum]TDK50185.1 sulfurtransferase TusA family protein [Antarcticimicrobium luteum]
MTWDQELDASGLLCPLPVLKARKRLKGMAQGQVLRLVATDPAAVVDVPHYCNESGNLLLGSGQEGEAQIYLIERR